MKLRNPFSQTTRELFRDTQYYCFRCGGNGGGMTELNHTSGRDSNNPINASVLCKACHSQVGHNEDEEVALYKATLIWLAKIGYVFTKEDQKYIENNPRVHKALMESVNTA